MSNRDRAVVSHRRWKTSLESPGRLGLVSALLLGCLIAMSGCDRNTTAGSTTDVVPAGEATSEPVAKRIAHAMELHGDVRVDDWYWLRERDNPEVIAYLEAENRYTEAMLADTDALEDELYEEIKGRIRQDDVTVPFRRGDYWYYQRTEDGKPYPIHCRKRSLDGPEEVMIDPNALTEGGYLSVRGIQPSPDQQYISWARDDVGRRIYTLEVRNLATGEDFPDRIEQTTGSSEWASDGKTLFYSRQDPETLRPYQVLRHVLGTDPSEDVLVYEEPDETYYMGLGRSKSKRYIIIASTHTLRSEYRYLDASDPTGEWKVLLERSGEHEYEADHIGDRWYLRTNDGAENFRLVSAPEETPGRKHWREEIAGRDDVFLEGVELFDEHIVVSERREGLLGLRVLGRTPERQSVDYQIEFDEPAYDVWLTANVEPDAPLRYRYTSLTTPPTTYDHDFESSERTLLKQDEVIGYDPRAYATDRLWVEARDGARVPVSIVYSRDFERDGTRPLLLYAYGSYGSSTDASFRSSIVSLLDRGFSFAIAHIRGGQELGRAWYEDGKKLAKKNTFTDFIDVADYLVDNGYTSKDRLFARGGSAGGLLMGAIINMRPELFQGVVAAVPFVDVVTTMLDSSIPLTTGEWDEWGDPRDEEFYHYMKSYSPYDNVGPLAYPHLLVTTGLHDSQVQYWEPAKWVAKLRAERVDSNLLLLDTDMEAGHGGASDRYKRYRDTAEQYAFLLKAFETPRRDGEAGVAASRER